MPEYSHTTYGYNKDKKGLPDVTMHRLCMDEDTYKEKVKEWEESYDEEYGDYDMIHPDCQMIHEGMGSDVTLNSHYPDKLYDRTLSGLPLPSNGYSSDPGSWRRFSMSCHDLRRISDQVKRVCNCPRCKQNNLYTKIQNLEEENERLRQAMIKEDICPTCLTNEASRFCECHQ